MKYKLFTAVAVSAISLLTSLQSQAASATYTGVNGGDWGTGANWSNTTAPTQNTPSSDVYTIDGKYVVYTPGGDFNLNSTVTILNSGTWQQLTTSGAWVRIGNQAGATGTVNVTSGLWSSGAQGLNVFLGDAGVPTSKGVFNVAAAGTVTSHGHLEMSNSSTFTNAGSTTFDDGALLSNSTSFSNTGTLTLGNDLRLHDSATFSLQSGVVSTTIISFDQVGDSAKLTISGGVLNISRGDFGGIFSNGSPTAYVDFTADSTGVMHLLGTGTGENNITGGLIRYNGAVVANDGSVFLVTHPTLTSTDITLAIPEPSTYVLFGLGAVGVFFLRRKKAQQVS